MVTPLSRRAALALPLAASLPLLAPRAARAEPWRPSQQVRIVVPAAAGGTTDIMGRLLAAHLQTRWGLPAVAENRTGAGGIIGTQEVVRSKPDGLTLLSGNIGPQAIAYSLFRNLPYRPEDLLPVSNLIRGPNVLVIHPSIPAQTVPEFVAWLRANNGKASYGSPGVGQSPHLSAVWFLQLIGVEATHIPYRGAAPAMTELLAGNIQFMLDNLTTAIQQIRAGQVRALAVTSADRNPQLPELPSLRETMPELASYEVNTWFGMFLPAGAPAEVLDAYNAEIRAMVAQPEMQRRFAQMGGIPAADTPARFAAFVRAEIEKWGGVIRKEGLQLDVG
ncbi:tripartite tricarboxylate transporter substrate binding protein [Roseomonas sp. NAR14]|uniref:Tripartite tricarboxylate transporter substrate binding protein n=1 Tax=Roseomonas acroporae TaxID=2937791 RepID=A0A9X1Y9F7_9PROT|nr:tripartite tricarboxylate transporter substrate binding protein [Roseomonas acroporae]MCK8786339.1 tripartite tricarboxylate transporter substrate binding protein [Roseomonas acroporae]